MITAKQIILFGPPGVGKGTQAKLLSEKYKVKHISTGDILRAEIGDQTELGKKAKNILEAGQLVPDDIMIGIIKRVLNSNCCKNGFILDGFPRTSAQAKALEKLFEELKLNLDAVIYLDVNEDEIIKRLSNRYSCLNCDKTYNIPDNVENDRTCFECGGALIQRDDDKPQTVLSRLKVYKKSTEPVRLYYENMGKLHVVDGMGTVEEVNEKIFSILER